MEMTTITSAELQRHLGRYQDEAMTRPISITRNGRERIVMLSVEEYRRLKRRAREVLHVGELGKADLQAIASAKVPERYAGLDDELK